MNKPNAPIGNLQFDEDGHAELDVPQLAGMSFAIVPTKLQGRTVLKHIAKIPATDGEVSSLDDIIMGNASVADCVETLRDKGEVARETFLNAISGASDELYQDIVVFLSQYVPSNIQFIPNQD